MAYIVLVKVTRDTNRLSQWAQKVKPGGLATFEAKNGTFRVISQKSLLGLECRGISGLHFIWNTIFSTWPLGKDIGPRSQKWASRKTAWDDLGGNDHQFWAAL